jgi:prepilin-type N-terminal cleavage/methylation domain-containing protein
MTRRGFTLVELLIVMVVMGILASLALLKTTDLKNAAIATQVNQEMRAVQIAAFNYYADKEQWPAEAGPGQVPSGLPPLLPGALAGSFDRVRYILDYDNVGAGDSQIISISATTTDTRLMAKLVAYLSNKAPVFVITGNRVNYLISGTNGGF